MRISSCSLLTLVPQGSKLGAGATGLSEPGGPDRYDRGESREHRPRAGAAAGDAYSKAYIDFRRTQAVNDLFSAAKETQVKVDDLEGQIDAQRQPAGRTERGHRSRMPPRLRPGASRFSSNRRCSSSGWTSSRWTRR